MPRRSPAVARVPPASCGEAVTEAGDAGRTHARGMLAQVRIERGLVDETVLHDAPDPRVGRGRLLEDLGRQEARQLQHVGDVVAQPGVEGVDEIAVDLQLDFVDDPRCFRLQHAAQRRAALRP